MLCPNCNGEMWDNRSNKRNPKAPDFKCKDPNCIDEESGRVSAAWLPKVKPQQEPVRSFVPKNMTPAEPSQNKKEMIMSYAKDLVVAELAAGRLEAAHDVVTMTCDYYDRLLMKIRS
jgi:hypothetical protein